MKKSGGIVALISSICGILAAYIALRLVGIEYGSSVTMHDITVFGTWNDGFFAYVFRDFDLVSVSRWGGILFAMAAFTLAVICLNVEKRLPAVLLIICAAAGIVIGVPLVKLFMTMALIGGVLAISPTPNQLQYSQLTCLI